MEKFITICTVCCDDYEILNKNINIIEKRNNIAINWIIVINQYEEKIEEKILKQPNIKIIRGFNKYEIESIALDHSIGLNKTIKHIKTKYAIFIDPDFFLLNTNLISKVVNHMHINQLDIFGVPWHPKWYTKFRYFPCSHCLFINFDKIELSLLDFRPTIITWNRDMKYSSQSINQSKIKFIIKKILFVDFFKFLFFNRKKCSWDGDTTSRIYLNFFKKKLIKYEITDVLFDLNSDWKIPINFKLNKIIEKILPENLCYFPKKDKNIKYDKLLNSSVTKFDFETFFWKDEVFGFHVRGYPKLNRNKIKEIEDISATIKYLDNL